MAAKTKPKPKMWWCHTCQAVVDVGEPCWSCGAPDPKAPRG